MFDFFNLEISRILKDAEMEMLDLKHPYVGTEHLLLSLLKNSDEIKRFLGDYDLTYKNFRSELIYVIGSASKKSEFILYTPLLKKVINNAIDTAKNESSDITARHLLYSILEEGEGIAIRILLEMNIDIEKIYNDLKNGDTSASTNLELLKIGKNLNESVNMNEMTVGREKEIEYVLETLIRKNKNNPLLIGPAGVGKTAIVEELARKIKKKEVPKVLQDKIIVTLEMGALVSGTKYRGEFEERLTKIIKELEDNPKYILFIDEIHSMVNAGGAEGAINAGDIFKPYLARGTIKCIGATTTEEYNKFIAKDKALSRRFEVINVLEPNLEETKEIINKVKVNYEKHYDLKISHEIIDKLVELTDKYIYIQKNPDKSLDILDSVCAKVSCQCLEKDINYNLELQNIIIEKESCVKNNDYDNAMILSEKEKKIAKKIKRGNCNNKKINIDDILDIISQKCNVPNPKEKKLLVYSFKEKLKNKVIAQDNVINIVDKVLKNRFINSNHPISFIFNGTCGVGKSYISQEVSKILKMNFLKIDMSEYISDASISKLIGTSAGYVGYDDEPLLNKIKNNPYSLLLIENIDKSSDSVKALLNQIVETGTITNSKGEVLNFKNCIIIVTTNILNKNKLGFVEEKNSMFDTVLGKEFIGNVDEIIQFNNINRNDLKKYAQLKNIKEVELLDNYDCESYGFKNIDKFLRKTSVV